MRSEYERKPDPLTDQEKSEIFHFPRFEEEIKPWYKRLRDNLHTTHDIKIATVIDNSRTMIWLVDKLMGRDSVVRCVRAEREIKRLEKEISKIKQGMVHAEAKKVVKTGRNKTDSRRDAEPPASGPASTSTCLDI